MSNDALPLASRGARSHLLKRFVRLGIQSAAIAAITFGLAEVTVRLCRWLVPSALPSVIFYDQSYNRYRGRPGAPDYDFRLNSSGFKDVEFAPKKASGTYRILGIGDSFAFGVVPYEHNYLTLTERRLNEAGLSGEILNMGIPGIGPQDYLALLANEGLQLEPDMVVVSFFVGNDFSETMRWRTRLHELSAVLALIKYVIDTRTKFDGQVFHRQASYDDDAAFFKDSTYLEVEKERSWVFLKPPPHSEAFSDAVDYLSRIHALCKQRAISLLVLLIPDELQVNSQLQSRVISALGRTAADFDFVRPNRFLVEQLRAKGIESLDLLPAFAERSIDTPLYKPNDSHWNISGNKLAADLLERHLFTLLNAQTAGANGPPITRSR